MKNFLLIILFLFPVIFSAQVTVRDTTITWFVFRYELNENNTVNSNTDTENDVVSKMFSGVVVENEYLKVTLVPEFGGRILSMIYKPTGKEELYQNPAGAPYGIGQDWFYYKWLMVYGGIFPTLPEPEHGKAWLLPWDYKVLKETPDTFRCQMSWRDTVQLNGIDINKWKYGKTNLNCDFIITLAKGASALEADLVLYNDSNQNLDYEYWTCLTLAPGSEPGNPMTTAGAELIIPASKIKIPSWYPDIAKQEKKIPNEPGKYSLNKLRYWKNWSNDGIAYAWDDKDENYWGVINHDNEEGLIRVANNKITPGIKMWAWGYEQTQNIDPFKDPAVVRRPYIELWAGHSNEFFVPAKFDMNSTKKWKEVYVPTVGLSNVTNANNNIIADFKVENSQAGKNVVLNFTTTRPNNHYNVVIETTGLNPQVLATQNILPDPVKGNSIIVNLPTGNNWNTGDSLKYKILDSDEGNFLAASIPLDTITTGVGDIASNVPGDFKLYQNYPNPFNPETTISFALTKPGITSLKIYDVLGREVAVLVDEYKNAGTYKVLLNSTVYNLASGVYFYTLHTSDFIQTRKLTLLK